MKKLLLLLAGLLFAVLPSVAQTSYVVSSTGITRGEDLTSGDYLIYVIPDGTKTPGYVHYSTTGVSGRHYLTYPLNISSGIVSDPMYIWTVTKTPQNNFEVVLKSDPTKFWIDDVKWGQNMTGSQNKAVLITEDSEQGIKFRPAEEMKDNSNTTLATNTYMNCNGPIGENNAYTSLSYWGGSNGAATFIFYKVTETEASEFPFVLSDAPTSSSFAENTYWYYLTLRNKYAAYEEGKDSTPKDHIPLKSQNPNSYGSFWAFVKTESGAIEIYNAATGPKKVLASDAPEVNSTGTGGDKTKPTMIDKEELGTKTGAWSIKVGDDNTFYLKREGQVEDYYLNERSGTLAFWSNSLSKDDGGSQFSVSRVDISQLINSASKAQKTTTGAVGALTKDWYDKFTVALNQMNAEGLAEALKIRDLTGTTIQFDASKYYRLQNVKFGGIFGINPESMSLKKETAMDSSNANLLFKFEEGANGNVKIYHPNAKLYVGTAREGESVPLKEASEASEYTKLDWGTGNFGFKDASNLDIVQFGKNGDIGLYRNSDGGGKGGDHAWYLIPAEEIDVNITAAGYATVNYPFAVQLPEDESISAYIGTVISNDNSKLLLKKISNGLIPANTPVVLEGVKGETKTYTLTIVADDASTNPDGNVLKGTLLPEAISETFVLGMNNDKVGFYKLSDTDNTVGANKAYLPKSALPTLPAGVKGVTFSFDDNSGETTGIEDATINLAEEEFYDLQGRRVMNPTKGIYVTKSGKKVLFTK